MIFTFIFIKLRIHITQFVFFRKISDLTYQFELLHILIKLFELYSHQHITFF